MLHIQVKPPGMFHRIQISHSHETVPKVKIHEQNRHFKLKGFEVAYKKPQIDNWNKMEETLEVISFNLSILWVGKSPEDESDQKTQSDQIRTWAQISGLQVECPLHYQPRADTTLIPTPLPDLSVQMKACH